MAAVAAVVTIATPSSLPPDKHFQGWPFRVGPFSFAAQKPGTISGRAGHCGICQVARGPQGPSGKTPSSVEGPPEKRGTFRENGLWHGRSPGKRQDLPGKRPPAWKVPRKKAGPSRKMAPGMEGPPEKGRTFRENALQRGRSPGKRQDLPGKWPLAWKVPREKAGPSRKMASGMEGPVEGPPLERGLSTGRPVLVDGNLQVTR